MIRAAFIRCQRWLSFRALFGVLLVLCASSAGATQLVRVTSPCDGLTLRGGTTATIAWSATAPLPPEAEEWEAFLSVDGGHYYSTRITPHLDIAIRTFEWRVPNIASRSVRLLIRIGNERDESVVDVPLSLTIEPSPIDLAEVRRSVIDARGEAARPGDAPVVEWADGDREGHSVKILHAVDLHQFATSESEGDHWAPAAIAPDEVSCAPDSKRALTFLVATRDSRRATEPRPAVGLLRRLRRMNI